MHRSKPSTPFFRFSLGDKCSLLKKKKKKSNPFPFSRHPTKTTGALTHFTSKITANTHRRPTLSFTPLTHCVQFHLSLSKTQPYTPSASIKSGCLSLLFSTKSSSKAAGRKEPSHHLSPSSTEIQATDPRYINDSIFPLVRGYINGLDLKKKTKNRGVSRSGNWDVIFSYQISRQPDFLHFSLSISLFFLLETRRHRFPLLYFTPGMMSDGTETLKGGKLILKGLKFHGYHGVKQEEKKLGQKFLIDVDAWMDLRAAGISDKVSDTISYTDIYDIAREIVEGTSHNLLESVAEQIASTTLTKHPRISAVRVVVGKPHVSVHGPLDYLGVEIVRYRSNEIPI